MTNYFLINFFSATNRQVLLTTFVLFFSNQLLEFILLLLFNFSYSMLCSWDCIWYSGIVSHSYDSAPHIFDNFPKGDVANWAFFPLLPISAWFLQQIIGITSSSYSVLITSKLFFALSIFSFIKFGLAYYPKLNPWILGFVVSLNPYVIYANSGYTESAFLFFSCLFFYFFKKEYFLLAGIVGGFLSAVRLAGIFAVFAIIPRTIAQFQKNSGDSKINLILMILLMPLGLSLFMTYLYWLCGDALAFMHIQKAWGREIQFPWIVLSYEVLSGNPHRLYWALLSVFSLAIACYFLWQKNWELGLFLALNTIIPITTSLASMPRYIFWQAPFLLFLGILLSQKSYYWMIAAPFFIVGIAYLYYFWPTGLNWVI